MVVKAGKFWSMRLLPGSGNISGAWSENPELGSVFESEAAAKEVAGNLGAAVVPWEALVKYGVAGGAL
jgi:hypothetical protein